MLGMYVHTHWSYNHPYCARTWTLEDWDGYLQGLSALGYDTILIWPQHETMPVVLTPSDVDFLKKLGQVIDLGHQLGLTMLIGTTPNLFSNEKASNYTFESRDFFDTCRYVNPKDHVDVRRMLDARREQWSYLAKADGLSVIDSDPGGWPDSPSEDFVEIFRVQGDLMRELNPESVMYYWMMYGWPTNGLVTTFREILAMMKQRFNFPWLTLCCNDAHFVATECEGMADHRAFYPYGLVEMEPSFPLTNANPAWFRQEIQRYSSDVYPQGLMVNAQTHCLQIPRTYLAAHYAQGGTYATERLSTFLQELIASPAAWEAGFGWLHLEEESDYLVQRHYAKVYRQEAERPQTPGPLAGLMMMSPQQFLLDLADNLDIRADLIELQFAVNAGLDARPLLQKLVSHIRPYRDRLGYNRGFQGPMLKGFTNQLLRLDEPVLTEAVRPSEPDKSNPKGYLVNLIDVVEEYANS